MYRELRRNRAGGRYTAREAQSLADARLGNGARARESRRAPSHPPKNNQDKQTP